MGKVKKSPKPKPPSLGEVLTLAEAAAYLRVSEAGLEADARSGRLPARRVDGEWRFHRSGLAGWLSAAPGTPGDTPAEAALRRNMAAAATGDSDAECDTFLDYLRELRAENDRFVERGQAGG
jgi:excisionase family DNA binding protein